MLRLAIVILLLFAILHSGQVIRRFWVSTAKWGKRESGFIWSMWEPFNWMGFPHLAIAQQPPWAWCCSCFQSFPSSESRQRLNCARGSYLALIWVAITRSSARVVSTRLLVLNRLFASSSKGESVICLHLGYILFFSFDRGNRGFKFSQGAISPRHGLG